MSCKMLEEAVESASAQRQIMQHTCRQRGQSIKCVAEKLGVRKRCRFYEVLAPYLNKVSRPYGKRRRK